MQLTRPLDLVNSITEAVPARNSNLRPLPGKCFGPPPLIAVLPHKFILPATDGRQRRGVSTASARSNLGVNNRAILR